MVLEKFDVVIYSLIELNKAPTGLANGNNYRYSIVMRFFQIRLALNKNRARGTKPYWVVPDTSD